MFGLSTQEKVKRRIKSLATKALDVGKKNREIIITKYKLRNYEPKYAHTYYGYVKELKAGLPGQRLAFGYLHKEMLPHFMSIRDQQVKQNLNGLALEFNNLFSSLLDRQMRHVRALLHILNRQNNILLQINSEVDLGKLKLFDKEYLAEEATYKTMALEWREDIEDLQKLTQTYQKRKNLTEYGLLTIAIAIWTTLLVTMTYMFDKKIYELNIQNIVRLDYTQVIYLIVTLGGSIVAFGGKVILQDIFSELKWTSVSLEKLASKFH